MLKIRYQVMGLPGLMGTGCTPITVIGTGSGSDCTQQPVCCSDNYFVRIQPSFSISEFLKLLLQNGLINVGCSPINLSL